MKAARSSLIVSLVLVSPAAARVWSFNRAQTPFPSDLPSCF